MTAMAMKAAVVLKQDGNLATDVANAYIASALHRTEPKVCQFGFRYLM